MPTAPRCRILPQALHGLVDALVVVLDALRLRTLLAMPVGQLEAPLGGGAGFAEQVVVAVESVDQRLGDVEGAAVGELVRKHGSGPAGFRQGAPSFGDARPVARASAVAAGPARRRRPGRRRRRRPREAQVFQQAVVQAVDPAVHHHTLATLPGVGHHRGVADVARLLQHVQLHQRVDTQASGRPARRPPCASRTSFTWRSQLSTRPARGWSSQRARHRNCCGPPR
jgi:hypothetical protein